MALKKRFGRQPATNLGFYFCFSSVLSGLDDCYYCSNIIVCLLFKLCAKFSLRFQERSKVGTCCPETDYVCLIEKSYQLPSCDLVTSLALLSSFGRETSLVKITGPRSIFTLLFAPSIYFHLLLSFALLSLALILCKRQGRRNRQLLCTRWEQSYLLLCAGPRQLSSPKQFLAPLS